MSGWSQKARAHFEKSPPTLTIKTIETPLSMVSEVPPRGLSENFDDRVTCVSCQNLTGWPGRWRCKNWRIAAVGSDDALAGDLIELPQRCPGWRAANES